MQRFNDATEEIFKNYYKSNDNMKAVLEKSRKRQAVIFGAGELGHRMYHILKKYGISVKCFCDNLVSGRTDSRTGMEITGLKELKEDIELFFVLIAVYDNAGYASVYQQLLDFGFESSELINAKVIVERLPVSFLEINVEQYRKVYGFLEDDFSKQVYLDRIKKAYLYSGISQNVSCGQEEYFDGKVILTDEEVFVDCGGFDGDTALKFIDRTNGRYKKIIIFEPEISKENLIRERMKDYKYDFYPYGVWSHETVLRFDASGDLASHVSETGNAEVKARALDETVFEDAPTYIKMDIEGSEAEALRGCRKIIQKYKPKLAICIYHKPEDLFEIPILIKEMCREYKIVIRQYADSIFETVCYAI